MKSNDIDGDDGSDSHDHDGDFQRSEYPKDEDDNWQQGLIDGKTRREENHCASVLEMKSKGCQPTAQCSKPGEMQNNGGYSRWRGSQSFAPESASRRLCRSSFGDRHLRRSRLNRHLGRSSFVSIERSVAAGRSGFVSPSPASRPVQPDEHLRGHPGFRRRRNRRPNTSFVACHTSCESDRRDLPGDRFVGECLDDNATCFTCLDSCVGYVCGVGSHEHMHAGMSARACFSLSPFGLKVS